MKEDFLKNICELKSGSTPRRNVKEYWNKGDIPWAKISDLEISPDGLVYDTEEYITQKGLKSINNRFFPKGTLLFAMYGSVGKTAIANIDLAMNQAILGINIKDENKVDLKYLRYWLSAQKNQLLNRAVGGTLKNLSKTIVENLKIPLPPIKTQKSIAARLDRAEWVKQLNRQLLAKYDELAQSLFLEMFGDPVVNEKGWEKNYLIKLSPIVKKTIKPEEINNNTYYIGLENVIKETGELENVQLVKESEIKSNKYIFNENYILYGRLRPYLNKVANPDFCGICSTDIIPFLPDNRYTNKQFITYYLKGKWFVDWANNNTSGANLPRLNNKALEKYKIINPPLTLQTEFARRIENIEHQKSLLRLEMAKSEELFESLLQESFDFNKPAVTV